MHILNSKGSHTGPCGKPTKRSFQLLKVKLTLVLYILLLRKLEIILMDS